MANVTPRRKSAATPKRKIRDETPWTKGDPTKKIGLNVPIQEPLMLMLDYLVEHRAIFSKSSFIRETVERAAEQEIVRLRRVQEAVRRVEAEDKKR